MCCPAPAAIASAAPSLTHSPRHPTCALLSSCLQLRCIGATTLDEYRQYIEKDPALER